MESFQLWIEKHADGVKDFFMAGAPHREGLVFQFMYADMLDCHRLFVYDPIGDVLMDFFAGDFTDFEQWIFTRLDEYFGCDYEILM